MTDLEKFIEFYKQFGIDLIAKKNIHNDYGEIVLALKAGDHDKFIGYDTFLSEIYFDKDGNFIQQGFWEGTE